MVELATLQGHDGHLEILQIVVGQRRVGTQSTTELRVHIVLDNIIAFLRLLGEELYSLVAQHPDADIGEVIMIFLKLVQGLDAGFLQHVLKHLGRFARTYEHTVVLGH